MILLARQQWALPPDGLLEHEPSFRFSLPIDWLVHSIHKRHVEMVVDGLVHERSLPSSI